MTHINNSIYSDFDINIKSENGTKLDDTVNTFLQYNFKSPIVISGNYDLLIKLKDIQIPMSYYICNDNNNLFIVNVNSVENTLTFDNGNPTILNLIADITNAGFDLSASYSSLTNKITITSTYYFYIDSSNTSYELLGFSSGQHNSSLISGTYTLVSDNVVNLAGTKSFYLYSSSFHNNHYIVNQDGLLSPSTLVAKIPALNQYYGIERYENINASYVKTTDKTISEITLELRDDDDNLLDLNNINWSCTLSFSVKEKEQFKADDYYFNEMIKKMNDINK